MKRLKTRTLREVARDMFPGGYGFSEAERLGAARYSRSRAHRKRLAEISLSVRMYVRGGECSWSRFAEFGWARFAEWSWTSSGHRSRKTRRRGYDSPY